MNEIKFRAFIKHLGQLADVLSIDFLDSEVEIYLVDRDEIRKYRFGEDEIVLLPFTGLKDKNGREIYEGDIVRVYGGEYWYGCWELDIRGEVVFDVFSFGVKSKDRFYPFNYAFEPYDHKIKVIGNIYENPELLEGEE